MSEGVLPAVATAPAAPRPFGRLWPFLRITFATAIVADILYGAYAAIAFDYYRRNPGAVYAAETIEAPLFLAVPRDVLGLAQLVLLIAGVIAYCRFFYRAMKNLHAVDAAGAETTPFWSVGTFFIPIANLWKPLGAVRQIWRASHDPVSASVKVPAVIGWWWFAWIVGSVISNISFRLWIKAGAWGGTILDADLYLASLMFDVIACALFVVAAALVITFASRIKVAQEAKIIPPGAGR